MARRKHFELHLAFSFLFLISRVNSWNWNSSSKPEETPSKKRTPSSRPSASVVVTSTLVLGDGPPVTGFVYSDYSVVSEIIVHPSQNGEVSCPYLQPTGSGSAYISCCEEMAKSVHEYRSSTEIGTVPSGYRIQTVCPNGLSYITTQSTKTTVTSSSQPTLITEDVLHVFKRATFVETYANDVIITSTALLLDENGDGPSKPFPTTLMTEFPCRVPEKTCNEWSTRDLNSFLAKMGSGSFLDLNLAEILSMVKYSYKSHYMCDKDPITKEPKTWYNRTMTRSANSISKTTSEKKITTTPATSDAPCLLHGNEVTVYYYASKTAVDRNICENGSSFNTNGVGAATQTYDNDTSPQRTTIGSQIVTLPVTSRGALSMLKTCSDADFINGSVCTQTERRTAVISYTEVPMYENKIYLHFDRLTAGSSATYHESSMEKHGKTYWSTEITTAVIEVDTSEVSTWALNSKLSAVNMADWEWPYHTRKWWDFCDSGGCSMVIQGKFSPAVAFPTKITEVYPQLSGCLLQSRWLAPKDPPRILAPELAPNGETKTTLSPVHWSPLYHREPEPGASVSVPEPMNTAYPINTNSPEGPAGHESLIDVSPPGGSDIQRILDIGSSAILTAAPDPSGGVMIINGVQVGRNSEITLSDGRKAYVDRNGNLIAGDKTWLSQDLFGLVQQQTGSRSNLNQGSVTTGRATTGKVTTGKTSGNDGQAEEQSKSGSEKSNGTIKKNESAQIMGMWWICLPVLLAGTVILL